MVGVLLCIEERGERLVIQSLTGGAIKVAGSKFRKNELEDERL
jgi:hypothetical protein